ncbi:MAG: hypothetical protein U5O39_03750 [Gammaproteobacteria bacterium]|nr:hypothetical protein [Gammaproteobacteria bacterium]
MPITFDFDPDTLVLTEVASGQVSPAEFASNLARFEAILPEGAAIRVLSDYRLVEAQFSYPEISLMKQSTNAMLMKQNASARTALVVNEKIQYGLARIYSMVEDTEAFEVGVFNDLGEARLWLGLD